MKPEGQGRQPAEKRFHFTKTALLAVHPAKDKRITVYDQDTPRLCVRITPAGTRTFYVVKKVAGVVEWVKLDTLDSMTVEQARKRAQVILGEFARGLNPAEARREAKAEMTAGEAFELYVKDRETRGARTTADMRAQWERYLGELPEVVKKKHGRERTKHPAGVNWQNTKLRAITFDKVRKLHADIGSSNPTTANRVIELVSAMFNFLKLPNPTEGIEPFAEVKRERFLSGEELPRFFATLAEDTSQDFREMVATALLTGQRIQNVVGARWRDVHMDREAWAIPAADAKMKQPIHVPLVAEVIDILKARRERDPEGEFVFPAESASGHATRPKKKWRQLFDRMELNELTARLQAAGVEFEPRKTDGTESIERGLDRARCAAAAHKVNASGARIEDVRIHDLRRTLGSWQAIQGASLLVIGKSLGHRNAASTQVYAHLSMDPVRDSVNKAASAILVAGGVKPTANVRPIAKPKLVK